MLKIHQPISTLVAADRYTDCACAKDVCRRENRIAVYSSAEEIKRISDLLEQNGIKYEIRTKRSRGSIGSAIDSKTLARANLSMHKGTSFPPVVYMVWVKGKTMIVHLMCVIETDIQNGLLLKRHTG